MIAAQRIFCWQGTLIRSYLIIICTLLGNIPSQATTHFHDQRTTRSHYRIGSIDTSLINTISVLALVQSRIPELKEKSFVLVTYQKSQTGHHFQYQQNHLGYPIYRATLKVNINNDGRVASVFDNSLPVPPRDVLFPNHRHKARQLGHHQVYDAEDVTSLNPVYYYDGITWWAAFQTTQSNHMEVIVSAENEVLYQKDLNRYSTTQERCDTVVAATVFNPDPLTSANAIYGDPFEDNGDTNSAALNGQLVNVNLTVEYDTTDQLFYLENAYFIMKHLEGPAKQPPTSPAPQFNFNRSDTAFEFVNTFYHLNRFYNYIKSIGFDVIQQQIQVDAHGSTADHSFYRTTGVPRLLFGDGGVDDAEDADVVVHEFGHALSDFISPNTNSGKQREAIDEGYCDYLAAAYSKEMSEFRWQYVFSWDGHNPFFDGRTVIEQKIYPNDLVSNVHLDGEIWSAMLTEMMLAIGREQLDSILFESMYSYAADITMPDAARLLILADSSVHQGRHVDTLCHYMTNRGIQPDIAPCQTVVGIASPTNQLGNAPLTLEASVIQEQGTVRYLLRSNSGPIVVKVILYNQLGQKVVEDMQTTNQQEPLLLSLPTTGAFFLSVSDGIHAVTQPLLHNRP